MSPRRCFLLALVSTLIALLILCGHVWGFARTGEPSVLVFVVVDMIQVAFGLFVIRQAWHLMARTGRLP